MKGQSVLFSSDAQNWETPRFLFNALHERFKFVRDVAASDENHLLPDYFTEKDNALRKDLSWGNPGEYVFCNPPYSITSKFVEKAFYESVRTVFLIPARTDTKVFHEWIWPGAFKITLIKGRLHFGQNGMPSPHGAGFPAMIVEYGRHLSMSRDVMPYMDLLDLTTLPRYAEYKAEVDVAKRDYDRIKKELERQSR